MITTPDGIHHAQCWCGAIATQLNGTHFVCGQHGNAVIPEQLPQTKSPQPQGDDSQSKTE